MNSNQIDIVNDWITWWVWRWKCIGEKIKQVKGGLQMLKEAVKFHRVVREVSSWRWHLSKEGGRGISQLAVGGKTLR